MNIEARVTISRSSDNMIRIAVECDSSHTRFVEVKMDCEGFAKAITGQGFIHCTAEVRGLDFVGKKRIVERRRVQAPNLGYGRQEYESWLANNYKEEGWIVNSYLGSQGSISDDGVMRFLNFSVERYEDAVEGRSHEVREERMML